MAKATRGGTASRTYRRSDALRITVTAAEHGIISERARAAGMSTASFLRDLGTKGAAASGINHSAVVGLLKAIEAYDAVVSDVEEIAARDPAAASSLQGLVKECRQLQRVLEEVAFTK